MQNQNLKNQLMQAMALRGGQQAPQPMNPQPMNPQGMAPQGMGQQSQQVMQNLPAGQQAMLQKMMGG